MKNLVRAIVYTALALGANTALAGGDSIVNLRVGDMKKLIVHETPVATSDAPFYLEDDVGKTSLRAYRGKYILLNFWATWCAPCRKEMPALANLQKSFKGDHFEVLTIATGRNTAPGISKFFKDANITNLPRHQDPKQALASQMGIFGLPITVILDPEGNEIARLRGDAEWDSEDARKIIKTLIDGAAS